MKKILRIELLLVFTILIIGFLVRLYKIDAPIADWHSWRQSDTAAVTRDFVKNGFNPFVPRFNDLSAISESPITNPLGFRFVEFPIYNIFVYPLYSLLGAHDAYHRLVSVFFSLGSIVMLYLIVRKYVGKAVAFTSALMLGILPFNVFFSRTTLPEPTFIFFSLVMIFTCSEWLEKKSRRWLVIAFAFTSIAFLIKPWAIFYFLPICYIAAKQKVFKQFALFAVLAVLPFVIWRVWILQHPEGIPASSWLLNGDGIRFRPAFWWWIISQRIGGEILGVTGFALMILGVLFRPKNGNYFFHFWLLSICLYLSIFATGNVRHNYYQLLTVPVLVTFFSNGLVKLIRGEQNLLPRIFTIPLAIFLFGTSIYFSFKYSIEFYKINNPPIIKAGQALDAVAPKDALVIAPYNGDTAFLYQTNRQGWAFVPTTVLDMIADYHVTYYVSTTNDARTAWVMRQFKPIIKEEDLFIADLTQLSQPLDQIKDPEPR